MKFSPIMLMIFFASFLVSPMSHAQSIDDLKAKYSDNKMTEALVIAEKLLKKDPADIDAKLYHIRILYILGEKAKSFSEFTSLVKKDNSPYILDSGIDLYTWEGNYDIAHQLIDKSLSIKKDKNIQLKKVELYLRQDKKNLAIKFLEPIKQTDEILLKKYNELLLSGNVATYKNYIGGSYSHSDLTNNTSDWNQYRLDLGRKETNYSLNIAVERDYRFDVNSTNYLIDFYKPIEHKNYYHLFATKSDKILFANYSFGGEFYTGYFNNQEFGLGLAYANYTSTQIRNYIFSYSYFFEKLILGGNYYFSDTGFSKNGNSVLIQVSYLFTDNLTLKLYGAKGREISPNEQTQFSLIKFTEFGSIFTSKLNEKVEINLNYSYRTEYNESVKLKNVSTLGTAFKVWF